MRDYIIDVKLTDATQKYNRTIPYLLIFNENDDNDDHVRSSSSSSSKHHFVTKPYISIARRPSHTIRRIGIIRRENLIQVIANS